MSKKIISLRIIIISIIILFCILAIFLIFKINSSVSIKQKNILTETTIKEENKIIFDLTKSPKEQKRKLKNHIEEYEDQVYHYLFSDEKIINTAKFYGPVNYYHLTEHYSDVDNVYFIYKRKPLSNLINMIFSDEDIDYTKYAFTENYIEHHPNSLREEFSQYFNEDYSKPGKGKMYDMNYNYLFAYDYGIGCNREMQTIIVNENKMITYMCEDGTGGSLWGKKGSRYDGKELYADLRKIYFKYKLDEKGYLDDVWFDHIEVLNSEQDLDDSVY